MPKITMPRTKRLTALPGFRHTASQGKPFGRKSPKQLAAIQSALNRRGLDMLARDRKQPLHPMLTPKITFSGFFKSLSNNKNDKVEEVFLPSQLIEYDLNKAWKETLNHRPQRFARPGQFHISDILKSGKKSFD